MSRNRINPPQSPNCFSTVLSKRLGRRDLLKASGGLYLSATLSGCVSSAFWQSSQRLPIFPEVPHGLDEDLTVALDHEFQVLLRWGDPINKDAPAFDPHQQSESAQSNQFGYNNDYIGFVSWPINSGDSSQGLLVVNHEYTHPHLMFPQIRKVSQLSLEQTKVDIVAHGLSVVKIEKVDGDWRVDLGSEYNRRITPYTEMTFSGPAAGSERLLTDYSHNGMITQGTYNNCAGGVTPWGTILTAEENVDEHFTGHVESSHRESENYLRFGYRGWAYKNWSRFFPRWDLSKNSNELNHMGWIVEIDPFDPQSKPIKRTALGRCKHEGCNLHINKDERVVAYTGDDQAFEYIYRFVSDEKYRDDRSDESRQHNMQLLDKGTLSVARFEDDGKLNWLPLEFGKGPLTPENKFYSQGDVVIELRRAGDLVGATPMDRPEDIEISPANGKVYAMLTKNAARTNEQLDESNPREKNRGGHIIEMIPPGNDHTAEQYSWEVLLLAGDPSQTQTNYHPSTSDNGWFACPDNAAFDDLGNLWVATDGAEKFGVADGLWWVGTEGEYRGYSRRFLRAPVGAELCGPFFTPDATSLFCAIQHPGAGKATFEKPKTRWPDFDPNMPPRPSVVVITKSDGSEVGR